MRSNEQPRPPAEPPASPRGLRKIKFPSANWCQPMSPRALMALHFAASAATVLRDVWADCARVAIPRGLFRRGLERIRRLRLPETVPR
jgi:hypothetical protein